jgi:alkylated DNA repair dioxygenase AlkB
MEQLPNLLPYDGTVFYLENFIDDDAAKYWYERLRSEIEWRPDEVVIFGKHMILSRLHALYGLQEKTYNYSGIERKTLRWNDILLEIKQSVEACVGKSFNACLVNFYKDGTESMGWHADSESSLVKGGAIVSVSLGAQRKFLFKHKTTKERVVLNLASGSLLEISGLTQQFWKHVLPASKKVKEGRINLTFRQMV